MKETNHSLGLSLVRGPILGRAATSLALGFCCLIEDCATRLLFFAARLRKRRGIAQARFGFTTFDRLREYGAHELFDGDVSPIIIEVALASALKATPQAELKAFLDFFECKLRTCRLALEEERKEVRETILELQSEEPFSITFERLWRNELARREADHRDRLKRVGVDLQEASPC